MKLSKEEKKVWQKHFGIEKLENIPTELTAYSSIDGYADDELMFYLAKRVAITKMYLKCSFVTDEGVVHISKIQQLSELHLRDHKQISRASIAHFNKMPFIERLNITLTSISLTDLCEHLNNQNLKEVFLSSEEDEKKIEEKGFILKERMPNCNIYLDCSETSDVFGNPEKPIY